jgi:hypothetical protein
MHRDDFPLNSNDNYDLDNMFFEADNLIKDSKIGDAYQLLLRIVETDPSYGRAYNHLGWL